MKYTKLSTDQQKAMLEQRLAQYEAEHFSHQINLDLLQAGGDDDPATGDLIAQAQAALATLDKAHAEVVKKLKGK